MVIPFQYSLEYHACFPEWSIIFRLLGAVNTIFRVFPRNSDYVLLVLNIERIGSVGHTDLDYPELFDLFCTTETTGFNYL